MSRWTHHVCAKCYEAAEPGRRPIHIGTPEEAETAPCCLCGKLVGDGIFYRFDPERCAAPKNHESGGILDEGARL